MKLIALPARCPSVTILPRQGHELHGGDDMSSNGARLDKEHREFFNIDPAQGWETVAPGIEARILAGSIDEAAGRGHLNRVVRWAPHAEIDAVREHDFYEEVFVAEGSLFVASQADPTRYEEFRAPAFACRPPHAKHGPFRAGPQGCLLFETQFFC